jgi:glycogen synthase
MADTNPPKCEGANRFKRILYAAGQGNVLGTYHYWRQGLDDPSQISITYSSLFYDLCRDLGIEALVIATHLPPDSLRDGPIRIEHRRVLWAERGGLMYHLGQLWYHSGLIASALRFRANALVVANTNYGFMLSLLRLFRIEVINSVHATFWPAMKRPDDRLVPRILLKLNGWFWRQAASATLCVSPECARQIREISGTVIGPIHVFCPQYHRQEFDALAAPQVERESPFRIMFAGRIERNKGVFDILAVADELERRHPGLVEWALCGSGSAEVELRAAVEASGLSDVFRLKGYLNRTEMFQELQRAHALIAPTTNEFTEGLNKVAVESILAGRPLVTTTGVPAIDLLGDATIVLPPGDVDAYTEAVLRLATDSEFFESKRRASLVMREQFFDRNRGWGGTLKRILLGLSGVSDLNPSTIHLEPETPGGASQQIENPSGLEISSVRSEP